MDFTAIDFETATGARDSACSVAVVAVQSDKLVRSYYTRIRPPFNKYNPFNISIHGIHEEDTENERDFAGIWESLAKELEGRIVLAHNAPFDMGVLRACIHRYDLKWPKFSYADTVKIAHRVWPELENHKLNTIADHLNVRFKHHDALEDAKMCAAILIRAAEKLAEGKPADLFAKAEEISTKAFLRKLGIAVVPF